MEKMIMRVGFAGLGRMGEAIAKEGGDVDRSAIGLTVAKHAGL